MANAKAAAKPTSAGTTDIGKILTDWLSRNRYYIIAFFIPVVLMYISYAIFGLAPFGEKSVLALDFNAQYVYYFEALRDAFWGDGSIFYSWGRNLSGGMMGVIGYYLASPFTLIVMILPRKMILTSLLIMILCKIGTASVTFNLYLQKSKKLPPLQATIFSVLYSLMAYMVIQTIDPMWLDGLVLLPLVALGIEHVVDDGRKLGYIIPLALMFISNFYIGYMIGIFAAIYFIYYLFFGSEEGCGKIKQIFYTCCNFAVCSLVAVMMAAFMILPVYNALQLGKFDFTDPDYSFKVQFEPTVVLAQLLTAQYDSVNVQGSPEIYCGILTVVLLPLFFLNSRIDVRRKLGYGFLMAVMFFSMYIKPVDMWWHGGQVPNWLPFRYSFIISFILLSMAATAWKHLDGVKPSHIGGVFFGVMAVILYIHGIGYEHLDIMSSIWLSIGLSAAYLLIIYVQKMRSTKWVVPILLLCVISGELIFNTVKTMKAVDKEVVYSTGKSYEPFVENGRIAVQKIKDYDNGFYRSEKTYTRCINDNMAFGLRGLTHSSSVMNAKTLNFIETLGYNTRSYYSRYDGTTELGDCLLGIKYIIDRDGRATPQAGNDVETIHDRRRTLLHDVYPKIAEHSYTTENKSADGTVTTSTTNLGIYQNPNALSIGYLVDDDLLRLDHLGNDNPFNSQNVLLSTMVGKTLFNEEGNISGNQEYYTRIDVGEPVLGAVTVSDYNGQTCYTKMDSGDPTVDYCFTAESDEEVLFFLKTENEQAVNLWLGVYDDATGSYTFGAAGFGQYFETHNYSILSLGHFTPGTKVVLRMTVLDKDKATIVKEPYFYYFNRDKFLEDLQILQGQQMEIDPKSSDTHIKGTVTAQEGQVLFTSIPYEPGWTVRVDGHKVKTTECLKAMIYVQLSAGTHKISMSYTPPGLIPGLVLLAIGIAMCVVFYQYDKKNNKVLLARSRAKKAAEKQQSEKKPDKKSKKPSAPAKKEESRGSDGAEDAADDSDDDPDEDDDETDTADEANAPTDDIPDEAEE